jgi:peroxiredoxin
MNDTSLEDAFRRICATEAPLGERLNAFSEAVRRFSLPFANVYDDLVTRIRSGEAGAAAPKPGEPMPPFVLPNSQNRLMALEELLSEGPVVVSFNRGHWCEYCLIELAAFREAVSEFSRIGAQVISIMPETQTYISALERNDAINIVSDVDNGYALELGLAIWVGDDVRRLYQKHRTELQKFNGNDTWFLPIPATFVVGKDGIIIDRYVDPDFRNRMEIADIVTALGRASR